MDVLRKIEEIQEQIDRFARLARDERVDASEVISALKEKQIKLWKDINDWERVAVARNSERPRAVDYIGRIFEDFIELHGDRCYGDDKAMIAGLAKFNGRGVVVLAQEKGGDTSERLKRNFGMPHPEGYRKAQRLMLLAQKTRKPVICLIDTPGAFPGIEAEERGQGFAIASNLMVMSRLKTPIIAVIIGEGASGGALGIGVADRLVILENSWFSVISPEGCSAILWKDASKAEIAAKALKLTSKNLMDMGIVDMVVEEPVGGAHMDSVGTMDRVGRAIKALLADMEGLSEEELLRQRYEKYRRMGKHTSI
ncbi:MAG: acetyl-CoA carboxylase carboxyl transferase subunit alpha [Candidatus Wallbacteria bacterium HGW-Wallbacteria-1]|jgi:acetyl-CoA carboxylase carboxyl transferase subunit alpha|uniref:Acetyl-coenzyme A carboxylase carboxyl transferase subunit alpha n=1 Tax=Candidatus Wallbacteria bacterium HGW-Wallbacteria-1 TaxID=2013854 RepID=A0A2N1PSF4_9BACT|nr:MAG: acetyl-CoA carboxylase carboxyl transferase subunit alpha [Candidatus Wallbacteria bacterium HGW-Wallbacteria-1]